MNRVPLAEHKWKRAPFAHQREAFMRGARRSKFMFLMEQGTGKTDVMANTIAWHHVNQRVDRCIVVAPLSVLPSWLEVLEAAFEPKHKAIWLVGPTKKKLTLLEEARQVDIELPEDERRCVFVLVNYQSVTRIEEELTDFAKGGKTAMVLDESQNIKNHRANQTQACMRVRKWCDFRYIGTGTIITQDAFDAFSQCAWTNPGILGHRNITSYRNEFVAAFCQIPGMGGKVTEWKNLDRLAQRIEDNSFRCLKSECMDLPPKLYQPRYVELSGEQKRVYKEMAQDFIAELDGGTVVTCDHLLSRITKLAQVSGGFVKDDNGDVQTFKKNAKIEELLRIVDALNPEAKVIIWCRFTEEILAVTEALQKKFGKEAAVSYYGGTKAKRRGEIVKEFQNEENPRFFVGQPAAGGAGITLTRATYTIYYSNSYRLEHRLQSEDRNHRHGTKSSVTYIDLIGVKTMDAYILKTLQGKKRLADVVNKDDIRELLKQSV